MKRLLPFMTVVVLATCDSGPQAGELVIALASPNQQDGAVAFTLTAAEPNTIASLTAGCTGCQVWMTRVNDAQVRAIVTGSIVPGTLVRATVSDVKQPDQYSASLQQVAARSYELRGLSGYSLTVAKP
ncbi:MAG: hypothetical protein WD934_05105 [Gemmatimonadales bacterium]